MKHKSINQILCAALINETFRDKLLSEPAKAIDEGYLGIKFYLSSMESEYLTRIHADTLGDFAEQVHNFIHTMGFDHVSRNASTNCELNYDQILETQIPVGTEEYSISAMQLFEEATNR